MGQVGWEQMELGAFPPPSLRRGLAGVDSQGWTRRGFVSARLVVVTQRRESCWGLSLPRGQPGRGLCHTLLSGLFSRFSWHRIWLAFLCSLHPSGQ